MARYNAFKLAFVLCVITTAVNLQAPLYDALAALSGVGVVASTLAFACYVAGTLPVLLGLNGLAERVGSKPLMMVSLSLCISATLLTLLAPGIAALAVARFLLGVATALCAAVAPSYMHRMVVHQASKRAPLYVTASTALGFGLGAAVTSLFVLNTPSVTPPSLALYVAMGCLALVVLATLPDSQRHAEQRPLLRLPSYPPGAAYYGLAILLAWAAVGVVIVILPSTLKQHGLSAWSGFATFGICSCGVLFQPLVRRLAPLDATVLGLAILPCAFAAIAWGALDGNRLGLLLGAVAASSACYGFIYLGGLSGIMTSSDRVTPEASAGYFLMAYIGFSLPVMMTGLLVEALGDVAALTLFAVALILGALATIALLYRHHARLKGRQAALVESSR